MALALLRQTGLAGQQQAHIVLKIGWIEEGGETLYRVTSPVDQELDVIPLRAKH